MHHFEDPKILCPYNKSHSMASLRFTFHHAKCEKRFKSEHPSTPVLHCPNNYMHIFFDAERLAEHVPQCDKMNIRQCLEPYVEEKVKKRRAEFSPV